MEFGTIFVIAVSVAVDCFSVAFAAGAAMPVVGLRRTFRLSWHFALFQSMMAFAGWAGGLTFRAAIESYDHWIAFGLLSFVGLRMLFQISSEDGEDIEKRDPTKGGLMIMLSIATSIDSMAVGMSFSLLRVEIWLPVAVIGIVTAFLTALGLHLGRFLSEASGLGKAAERIGGAVLIAIGLQILHEHGVMSWL